MKKLSLFLAVLMCLSLAACGGAPSSSAPPASTSSPSSTQENTAGSGTDTEKELDVLRVGLAELPEQMDPMVHVGNVGIRIHFNIFETLILADQRDSYREKPMLAESWKRVDDYTVEFTLRKDVTFHNGDPLTSKDVVFSLKRLQSDIPNIELAASLMNTIKDVEAVDDYTVRVTTSVVDPILETRLASSWGAWILPADYINRVGDEAFNLEPIGTGPFKVISYSPSKVVLERYDGYWGEKPNIKRIEYIAYPETSARMTALMTGEVDLIAQLPADQIETIERQDGLKVISQNICNMHVLTYNTASDALKDKKVRQAMNLAIDRQLLADTLWGGKAVVPKGHQYPDYGDLYFDDYPTPQYDPEKAKALLAESSYNGEVVEYELKPGQYTFGSEAAEVIVGMWKEIGINAKIAFRDTKEYNNVSTWSNTMRFPDPVGGLWLLWGPGSTPFLKTWKDCPQSFVDAGNELASITDAARRKELARQMMEIWDEEAPGTVLYYPFESWGIREGFEWVPYSSQTMDFRAENFRIA